MDRRSFIRNLGLAVAGAAVASKIELIESIIPVETSAVTVGTNSATPISFSALQEAYNRACLGKCEPDLIFLNRNQYTWIKQEILPHMRFGAEIPNISFDNFRFQNAVTTYGELEIREDAMLKDFSFREDFKSPIIIGINKRKLNEITLNSYSAKQFYRDFV